MRERLSLFNRETGQVETLLHKVVRHVLTGEFDAATLKRGAKYAYDSLYSKAIRRGIAELDLKIDDFCGIEGMDLHRYAIQIPSVLGRDRLTNVVDLLEFPLDSRLKIITLPRQVFDDLNNAGFNGITKQSLALEKYGGVACFVGPTTKSYGSLPNNGYFDKGNIMKPFKDTYPVGQRRGAIAIQEDGSVVILEEPEKAIAKETKFRGFTQVSGTSFYIKSEDNSGAAEFFDNRHLSAVSYFILYTTASGHEGMAHLNVQTLVSRVFIKKLLDSHAHSHGWQKYIAAELELMNGGAFVQPVNEAFNGNVSKTAGFIKRDFYMVERDKSASDSSIME